MPGSPTLRKSRMRLRVRTSTVEVSTAGGAIRVQQPKDHVEIRVAAGDGVDHQGLGLRAAMQLIDLVRGVYEQQQGQCDVHVARPVTRIEQGREDPARSA